MANHSDDANLFLNSIVRWMNDPYFNIIDNLKCFKDYKQDRNAAIWMALALTFWDALTDYQTPDDIILSMIDELMKINPEIYNKAKEKSIDIHLGGCYVCTEGPRLETPAEINFFRLIGCDYVGMTLVPEIILARELGLCYASISIITNYAAGMQERVSLEEVIQVYRSIENVLLDLLRDVIKELPEEKSCKC